MVTGSLFGYCQFGDFEFGYVTLEDYDIDMEIQVKQDGFIIYVVGGGIYG